MVPKLILSPADSNPVQHEIQEEPTTIGRAPENTIRIDDISVSSRHARLEMKDNLFQLTDLESTNGTIVNGQPISSINLRSGDKIRFGKIDARFETEAPTAVQPLPDAAEVDSRPANASVRPSDFSNASPFSKRGRDKDAARTAILAIVIAASVAFVASMVAVLMMQPPAL